jgi:hypothetical protein
VAVEVASGSVVVLGRSRVGVAGEDLCVPQRDAGVEGVGDGSVPQGVGLMCLGMPATPLRSGAPSGRRRGGQSVSPIWAAGSAARRSAGRGGLEDQDQRDGQRHGGGLAACADQMQDAVPKQSFGVVLDPDGGGLGGA